MFDLLLLLAAAGADAAHGSAEAAHAAEDPGFAIALPKIISQLIAFGIVAFLLNKFAFGPLLAVMDQRQRQIDDGLKFAEDMKARLADAEAQHERRLQEASEQASQLIAEARANAKAFEERQREQATVRAEELVQKATAAMASERQQLRDEVRAEASRLVLATTAAVLGKQLSAEEQTRFSDAATEELIGRN